MNLNNPLPFGLRMVVIKRLKHFKFRNDPMYPENSIKFHDLVHSIMKLTEGYNLRERVSMFVKLLFAKVYEKYLDFFTIDELYNEQKWLEEFDTIFCNAEVMQNRLIAKMISLEKKTSIYQFNKCFGNLYSLLNLFNNTCNASIAKMIYLFKIDEAGLIKQDINIQKMQLPQIFPIAEDLDKKSNDKTRYQGHVAKPGSSNNSYDENILNSEIKTKAINLVIGINDVSDCPICSSTLCVPILTECGHTFCYECSKTWFKTIRNCPACRSPIYTPPILNISMQKITDLLIASNLINKPDKKMQSYRTKAMNTYKKDLKSRSLYDKRFG